MNRREIEIPTEGNIIVGPELAAIWHSEYHYDGQRTFRDWHAKNLAEEMVAGRFRAKTQIAFVLCDGKLYLTNGQHTLRAIELSKTKQLLSVVINTGQNMVDVADDFARHDTHLTRQFADSLVAHNMHVELGVSPTVLNKITAACMYYAVLVGASGSQPQKLTHDEKMVLVRKFGPLGRDACMLFAGGLNYPYLSRKTTLGSAMLTLNGDVYLAGDFWRQVVLDDGLRVGDPRKTLLMWLRDRVTHGGACATPFAKKPTGDHEFVKAIAQAWNAWVGGRELKLIRPDFNKPMAVFNRIGSFRVRSDPRPQKEEA